MAVQDIDFEYVIRTYHRIEGAGLEFAAKHDELREDSYGYSVRYRDFFGLCIVRRGTGTHQIDGVRYGMARGDIYVILPGTVHEWVEGRDLAITMVHYSNRALGVAEASALREEAGFKSLFLKDASSGPRGGRWLHVSSPELDAIWTDTESLRLDCRNSRPTGPLLAQGSFLRLLAHLARLAEQSTRSVPVSLAGRDDRIVPALSYLEENFTSQVRLEDLAALAFLSPDRFTRLFAAEMGCTPRDYLRHLRIERAKALLAATDLPIAWISRESGFSEAPYFSRMFRAATGMTPGGYRAAMARK